MTELNSPLEPVSPRPVSYTELPDGQALIEVGLERLVLSVDEHLALRALLAPSGKGN